MSDTDCLINCTLHSNQAIIHIFQIYFSTFYNFFAFRSIFCRHCYPSHITTMANRPKGYGFSAEVSRKIDSKYDLELEEQAVEWICSYLPECTPSPKPEGKQVSISCIVRTNTRL